MSSGNKKSPVYAVLEEQRMAQDFDLPAYEVASTLGLKTRLQISIDRCNSLETLDNLFSGSFIDKAHEQYWKERKLTLVREILSEASTSLSELNMKILSSEFSLIGLHDEANRLLAEFEELILSDTAKQPKNLRQAEDYLRYAQSGRGKEMVREITDALIKAQMGNGKDLSWNDVVELCSHATDEGLQAQLVEIIRSGSGDSTRATAWAYHSLPNLSKRLRIQLMRDLTAQLDTAATTNISNLAGLLNDHWVKSVLLRERFLHYAEIVFSGYLQKDDLQAAEHWFNSVFQKQNEQNPFRSSEERAQAELDDKWKKEWQRLYTEVFIRVNLPLVEAETSVEKLRRDYQPEPLFAAYYNPFRMLIRDRIQQLLDIEITKAPEDLEVLWSLMEWPEIEDAQVERIRQKRAPLLEERFAQLSTQEEYVNFWKLLHETEKNEWRTRVLQAAKRFYLIEGNLVEVEA